MKDNYLLTVQNAKKHFLTYDQQKLIAKHKLAFDDYFLYMPMLGKTYRICRATGSITTPDSHREVEDFGEVMTLLDMLCDSKENRSLTGNFLSLQSFGLQFHQNLLEQKPSDACLFFDRQPQALHYACRRLGGIPFKGADIAYRLPLFDDCPIVLQFWHGDDEFYPRMRWLFDENALSCIRYETMHYAIGFILRRLRNASKEISAMIHANSYANIDLDIITGNYKAICQKAGKPVMAIVKANAYGHGAVQVARALEKDCPFFGVATTAEALELRNAGISKPILLLGPTPEDNFPILIEKDIRPTIFTLEMGKALSEAAVRAKKTAHFHFAVDTGMSRIGFAPTEQSADICKEIAMLPGLSAEGLFSHFATADSQELSRTYRQAETFATFDKMLQSRGVCVKIRHLDNSAGIMHFGAQYEMARAGIILYGLQPSEEMDISVLPVHPALSWRSRVSFVKPLAPGAEVSYGGTFVAEKPMVVATIPVGYADGYRRSLSGKFYVLIHGQKAPILGRVCMDQFMVDVTHIPGVTIGDEVVLMGKSGKTEISVEEFAENSYSFNYETVCAINRRVPRVFYKDGAITEVADYLA